MQKYSKAEQSIINHCYAGIAASMLGIGILIAQGCGSGGGGVVPSAPVSPPGECDPFVDSTGKDISYIDFSDTEASTSGMTAQYNNLANVTGNEDVSGLGKSLKSFLDTGYCPQNNALTVYESGKVRAVVKTNDGCSDIDFTGYDPQEIKKIANTLLAGVNSDRMLRCPNSGFY